MQVQAPCEEVCNWHQDDIASIAPSAAAMKHREQSDVAVCQAWLVVVKAATLARWELNVVGPDTVPLVSGGVNGPPDRVGPWWRRAWFMLAVEKTLNGLIVLLAMG